MTNIEERLLACHGIQSGDPDCCCAEAAAEIKRLRAENARLKEIEVKFDQFISGAFI